MTFEEVIAVGKIGQTYKNLRHDLVVDTLEITNWGVHFTLKQPRTNFVPQGEYVLVYDVNEEV